MTYTITLHDFPGIADCAREKVQDQYRRTLEKALGSPDDVLPTYRAWLHVSESGSEELNADDATLADRWIKASNLARQAALRTLGQADAAYFEVTLG
jgi:hypothetical protein